MNRKDYSNASEIIHEGLQRYPNSVFLYSTSGDILANQKNIADARSAYKKALEEYYKQYPDIYEPPVILLGKLKRLGAD